MSPAPQNNNDDIQFWLEEAINQNTEQQQANQQAAPQVHIYNPNPNVAPSPWPWESPPKKKPKPYTPPGPVTSHTFELGPYEARVSDSNGMVLRNCDGTRFALEHGSRYIPQAGLLQPAVRWVARSNAAFLVERPPCRLRVSFYDGSKSEALDYYEEENDNVVHINTPWTICLIRFDDNRLKSLANIQLFVRPGPILTEEDMLYRIVLPNIDAFGFVCLGTLVKNYPAWAIAQYHQGTITQNKALQWVTNHIWTSGFNYDLPGDKKHLPPEIQDKVKLRYPGDLNTLDYRHLLEVYGELSFEEICSLTFTEHDTVGKVTALADTECPELYGSSIDYFSKVIHRASQPE